MTKRTSSATSEQAKAADTRLYIVRQKHRNDNDELHLVEASSAAHRNALVGAQAALAAFDDARAERGAVAS